jgi:hypothetical protein
MPQLPETYNFLPQESRELRENIISFCDSIQVIEIHTPSQYAGSAETGKQISSNLKRLEEQRTVDKLPYLEKGRLVDAFYKPVIESLDALKRKIGEATRAFERKQELIRLEEQRKLDEIARKKREEQERKAEEDRRKAEELRLAGEASKAESLEQRAADREIKAANIIAPVAQVTKPTVSGISNRKTWKGVVTDRQAFVAEMIKRGRLEFLMPDASAFNKYAGIVKKAETFPGGRIYLEESSSFRA